MLFRRGRSVRKEHSWIGLLTFASVLYLQAKDDHIVPVSAAQVLDFMAKLSHHPR